VPLPFHQRVGKFFIRRTVFCRCQPSRDAWQGAILRSKGPEVLRLHRPLSFTGHRINQEPSRLHARMEIICRPLRLVGWIHLHRLVSRFADACYSSKCYQPFLSSLDTAHMQLKRALACSGHSMQHHATTDFTGTAPSRTDPVLASFAWASVIARAADTDEYGLKNVPGCL
jgi:hypothetical protein